MRLIQYSSTGFVNIDKIDRIEVGLLVRFMCANDSEFVDVEKDFAVSFINQIQFNQPNHGVNIEEYRNSMLGIISEKLKEQGE